MKLNKSFFIAMAAIVGGLASSCSDDGVWNAAPSEGVAYSFNAPSSSFVYDGSDVIEDIDVVITRNTTNGEVALPILSTVTDPSLVTIPEEVVFADGSNTAVCKVSVSDDFTAGQEVTITLAISAEEYGIEPVVVPAKPTEPSQEDEEAYAIYLDSLEAYNAALVDYKTYTKKLANYKNSTTITIKKNETWALVGTGDYVYSLFFGDEDDPQVDPGLELYRSEANSSRYKITHWGYDVDFCFTMDGEGNILVTADQNTGATYSSYGAVYIADEVEYFGDDEEVSYFDADTNTFHFALVYYVGAGYLTYGIETFTLNASSEANFRNVFRK